MKKRDTGTPPNDGIADWLLAARDGSTEALGKLLEQCRPYLLLVSNRELDSGLLAKVGPSDLVQQTFLEAQKDFDRFHGSTEEELLAWLRRILLNNLLTCTQSFRATEKRQLDREISLEQADPELLVAPRESGVLSPSGAAMAAEERAALAEAVTRLPADYRQVVLLHHRDGRTFAEIGTLLGRSAEAVRKLWSRAIDRLQEELGDCP